MLKEVVSKYFSSLLLLLTVIAAGFFAYEYFRGRDARQYEELIGLRQKYEQLSKHTAKLEASYQEQKELKERADREWKEVVREREERIRLLSDATYLIGKHAQKKDGPDYYFETPGKTRNYVLNEVRLAGPDSPPIGFVMIKHDGRTYTGTYPFEIRVQLMQTVDEQTGKIKVYSKAFLVSQENGLAEKRRTDLKRWKDEPFPLSIVGGEVMVDPTQPEANPPRFYSWAPRLNGGINLGFDPEGGFLRPGLNVSFAGYGKSKNDLSWKFLQLGVSTDTDLRTPDLHLIPFSFRPASDTLPNTYIGPGVGWSSRGWSLFLNTSLGF